MSIKFNCKDVYGKQIEVVTKTSDMLVSILKSPFAAAEKKQLATRILDYIAQQVQIYADFSPIDQASFRMLSEFQADCVWTGIARLETQTDNGVERQVFVVISKAA
jgi:hypothetical protein